MKTKSLEVTRGSGNVFRDLGHENADIEQFKAILAAQIIKALDREGLSVRGARSRTGIAAADFSRIRNADLGRFTVDRLMSIINRLGSRVEVKVRVRHAETARHVDYQFQNKGKFALLTFNNIYVDLPPAAFRLSDGTWVMPGVPVPDLDIWKEWTGSIRMERLEKANLVLLLGEPSSNPEILDAVHKRLGDDLSRMF